MAWLALQMPPIRFVVMLVLAGLGTLEHRLLRVRRTISATVRTKAGTTLAWLKTALFADGLAITSVEVFDHEDDRVYEMRVSGPARQFDIGRSSLLERDEVLNVVLD